MYKLNELTYENINLLYKKIVEYLSSFYLNEEYKYEYESSLIQSYFEEKRLLTISNSEKDIVLNCIQEQAIEILNREYFQHETYNTEFSFGDFKQIIIEPEDKSEIDKRIEEKALKSIYNAFSIDDINSLSMLNYESAVCNGNLAITTTNLAAELCVSFDTKKQYSTPFSSSKKNLKYLRKLLQITGEDLYLVIKSLENRNILVNGFASFNSLSNIPIIKFKGKMSWEILINDERLSFDNGKYVISAKIHTNDSLELKKIKENLSDLPISENNLNRLINEICESKEHHGALFIFVNDDERINQLCQFSRGIKLDETCQIFLNNEQNNLNYIKSLCKIDGALIFNQKGKLLSIGTILDGCVVSPGDRGRGSRYNSSKTFVEHYNLNTKYKHYALVISEDGYINFLPKNGSNDKK